MMGCRPWRKAVVDLEDEPVIVGLAARRRARQCNSDRPSNFPIQQKLSYFSDCAVMVPILRL